MRTTATGREIYKFIEFFTANNAGCVENDGRVRVFGDDTGAPVLALDEVHALDELGIVHDERGEEDTFLGAFNAYVARLVSEDPRRKSPRYPDVFAFDVLRHLGPTDPDNRRTPLLTRDDASQVLTVVAQVLETPKSDLAVLFADYYLEHEQEIVEAGVERIRKLDGA